MIIDGIEILIEGEKNILELARKANIEIPTFCYHSELSVYGACRLCLVDIEGRGIVTSCSTKPEPGMKVKSQTAEIREMRKIAVELLLANHKQACPTCSRSASCKLQDLSRRLGITKVRFKPTNKTYAIDNSSPSLIRDPNKCVLCGDCVRMCREVQGIGAIDFTHRGKDVIVQPAFGKDLARVECVNCGQCAAVCPVGAIVPKPETDRVWNAIYDEEKIVVAQIAPAVRVALGEMFGLEPGAVTTGKIVAALQRLGFDKVYDTSFAADLTVIEEVNEFIRRIEKDENLPQFTSCCPAWVKFAEQYYPEFLSNLSSCRSPQQMFGSLAKAVLPEKLGALKKNLYVVSIMPCTAKKFEKERPEFQQDGADVDAVLTTQELGRMIAEAGILFNKISPESFDLPFGFKSGAGLIFGNSGGVSEAVLRYAVEKMGNIKLDSVDFPEVRGEDGCRTTEVEIGDRTLRLAVVNGLNNARTIAEKIKAGKIAVDLVEVMACPGGCVCGAGQPIGFDPKTRQKRTKGLYDTDKTMQIHKAQDNPYIEECYQKNLGEIGSKEAHRLLHTHYLSRKRVDNGLDLMNGTGEQNLEVSVCVGTNCYLKGSQDLLYRLIRHIENTSLSDRVNVKATFCFENCKGAPNVKIGEQLIGHCTFEKACDVLKSELAKIPVELLH